MNCGNITSRSNRLVKELRELQTKRKARYEMRAFVCDGIKLLGEAIESNVKIKYVFAEEDIALDPKWVENYPVYTAPRELMEYISVLECTQGVIFCCEMPEECAEMSEQVIILDHLQDTGNLGTIIRCADAFGISTVVLDGTADPYNPKTVRAAMGALFRVKLCNMDSVDAIESFKNKNIPTYAATLTEKAVNVGDVSLKRAAVVIGNEGNGVSDRVEDACAGHIILPMSGSAESLNASVAAGIIMWEMQKAR